MPPGSGPVTFTCQHTLAGHTKAIASVKFSPSGNLVAAGSADKSISLWSVGGRERSSAEGADEAPSTSGAAPASGSDMKLRSMTGHAYGISDVAWNPNERYLASASDDNSLKLWDVEAGKCLRTLLGHTNYVFCCSFDAHGHLLASGSFDETLRLWDVRCGKCLREVPAHSDPITAVHFSYDSTMLVTSSLDGLIRMWDTQTGHCLKTLFDKDSPPVSYVRFSPNAKYLLCNTLDGRARIWNYERGKTVRTYQGSHTNKEFCLPSAFCNTALGQWVVTGSEDCSVAVYDLNSTEQVATIKGSAPAEMGPRSGHCAPVLALDVHPKDEPVIVTGGQAPDNTIKIWAASPAPAAGA